ncbi:MAG: DUF4907 domain-containing protein [Bacteroidetes bacterium]|nr:DUF4907 domain-containing protein [Bacteroidota bacterium]
MNFFLTCAFFFCFYSLPPGSQTSINPVFYADRRSVIFDSIPNIRIDYKIITNSSHSYGYDIFVNGQLRIHQCIIPGVIGMKGFQRKADAKKVASLAIKKMKNGFMPPTILA